MLYYSIVDVNVVLAGHRLHWVVYLESLYYVKKKMVQGVLRRVGMNIVVSDIHKHYITYEI